MTSSSPLVAPLLLAAEIADLLKMGRTLNLERANPRALQCGRGGESIGQRYGSGLDFAETQPFGGGDDVRRINWRASARSSALQIQRYHQDLAPSVCIVIDLRSRMQFGTRKRLKATQAARLALVLAAAHARSGAEISALLIDNRTRWVAPATGMAGAERIAKTLSRTQLKVVNDQLEPALVRSIAHGLGQLPAGARLHLLSDFADLQDSDMRKLHRFNRLYDVTAWHIQDPAERKLGVESGLQLSWHGAVQPVDTRTVGNAWIEGRLLQHSQQIERRLSQAGIDSHLLLSDLDDLAEALGSSSL